MDNSPGYLVSFFGALKAGAAVVPLNVQLVPRELKYLLSDSVPRAVISLERHRKTVESAVAEAGITTAVVVIDGSLQPAACALQPEACSLPPEACSLNPAACSLKPAACDLAVILYTSGTTGKPKGVMLTHDNFDANSDSIIQYLKLTSDDSIMVVLPFFYSYGLSLLTTHIKVGGTLVIDNRFLYPNTILDTMQREGVTGFAGVPSHYAILLRKSALRNYKLPALRYVTQAGGAMSPAMIKEFIDLLPDIRFYVMYGQTEATARLSYLDPVYINDKMGSIGKAIPGVELAVLNEAGLKVKPGEIGEITAKGRNIMSGYWNSPAETDFVLKNGILYTGDLARVDEDGFLYVVSRKKDMIKSGANRISPFEIEDVVCQLKGVLECAAVGVPDEILGEAIRLCVVRTEDAVILDQDILAFCKQNLAVYKMPKQIVILGSLPKTSSGKIKREELK